jgi:hypothetical protein
MPGIDACRGKSVKEMRDRRVVPWASLRVAVVTISLFVFLNISGHWEPGSKLKKTKSRQKSDLRPTPIWDVGEQPQPEI